MNGQPNALPQRNAHDYDANKDSKSTLGPYRPVINHVASRAICGAGGVEDAVVVKMSLADSNRREDEEGENDTEDVARDLGEDHQITHPHGDRVLVKMAVSLKPTSVERYPSGSEFHTKENA